MHPPETTHKPAVLDQRAPTVLVVGAGHAGLEAAFAAARVGAAVIVVTGRLDTVGQTPCNPSVGGVAKGHLVHEIHALGGFMGRAADACAIHGRILNLSKGPAVHSTRLQVDKDRYGAYAQKALASHPGIQTIEGLVEDLIWQSASSSSTQSARVCGVRLKDGSEVSADAVVITTGTFLGGLLHTGKQQTPGGRAGEAPANSLSQSLRQLGFDLKRLKTGTPARLDRNTIHWTDLQEQGSDDPFPRFTCPDDPEQPDELPKAHCYITYTNPQTHEIIQRHIHESPMYSGQITGVGPRYCPSIEDKVVRFADRDRHQIFLEPEGLDTPLIYPNGISTSLPLEVQAAFIQSIAGLEQAVIVRPGYAVEYDAVDARALNHRLGSKDYQGLYFAGQINGTSGYEEAGIQGLVAGANAALELLAKPSLELERMHAYGGVLIDDLVTQGCDEPYRMFTSRAEYRLNLREDNADERLGELAYRTGLISESRFEREQKRLRLVEDCVLMIDAQNQIPKEIRPMAPSWIWKKAYARKLYAGYLDRQAREVARIRGGAEGNEMGRSSFPLPADLDYFSLAGLNHESAERLAKVRPASTEQASRIPGMTPAALACVWAHARILARQARAQAKSR